VIVSLVALQKAEVPMMRTARWSLVLGVAGSFALGLSAIATAYAHGGGGGGGGSGTGGSSGGGGGHGGGASTGGGGGGGGGGGAGKSGPKTGGGGSMGGGAPKAGKSNNTGSAKGRGDYLESLQRDAADDQRRVFLGDATMQVLATLRSDERGE
jgi:hypothetical protein